MPVEFEIEFNVETSTRGGYRTFITNLRQRLGLRSSHNRPALIVQEGDAPTRFFELILRTNNHSVRFRFRMDNLYLIGYQMEDGRWLEFNNQQQNHLILGSTFLGFGGDYRSLAGAAFPSDQQDQQGIEQIRVGYYSLVSAINQLATVTDRETRARRLVVVIMMICEASRLIPISDYAATSYHSINPNQEGQIQTWMKNLAHSWGSLSAALFRADAYPQQGFQLPENHVQLLPDVERRITTIAEAAAILGILLGLCFRGSGPQRFPRMADNAQSCLRGRPLVEVFSVRINNIDDENLGDLYGTIIVADGLNSQYIYNRTRDNVESIKAGDNATLTGPNRSILAYGDFTIRVVLTDKDTWSWDDEIINQEISWNPYDIGNVYDEPINIGLWSKRGSGSLFYAVLRDAVAAQVTVKLEEGGENTTEVYGDIQAFCGNWGDNYNTRSILFKRASNDYLSVERHHNIPLTRSVVAVPLSSSLKVMVNLKDYDPISADDVIADGTEEFPAEMSGTYSKIIYGADGNRVSVTVAWIFDI
ncbi:60 kDa jasmonate-induced protein-like isoform X2 [Tripterygium wilfordii]|uniref:rRNA N-glycosylase n=1 Tax=Tripterygium wilfordii TaxID=458696 RepID=A0A7J7CBT0_TRIWF|nr:uncharacterized protein LOC119983687 [Tripterygium wilfordii]XP_038683307.1 uncharacterized protein LOC119983687 [Tripterygium wilfordii]KAF5731593.1 60 kDa jasmonate-induced protein-like isoform X2 [Tripterygium wilfordii]